MANSVCNARFYIVAISALSFARYVRLTLAFFPRTNVCTKAVWISLTLNFRSISSPKIIDSVGVHSLMRTGSSCRKSGMLHVSVLLVRPQAIVTDRHTEAMFPDVHGHLWATSTSQVVRNKGDTVCWSSGNICTVAFLASMYRQTFSATSLHIVREDSLKLD